MPRDRKTKNRELINRTMDHHGTEICKVCRSVYKLALLKAGEDFNDFGFRYCPYCGDLTEGLFNKSTSQPTNLKNSYILITLSGGLINQLHFYFEPEPAIEALSYFVKAMNPDNEDAAVYNQKGLVANAKDFLDENDSSR